MATMSEIAATPRYLLLEGNTPIGPTVTSALSDDNSLVVYGFSGKPAYDRFIANSDRDLRPYPLMKGYLQKHFANDNNELRIVVLDADSPRQQTIMAVTMKSAFTVQSDNAEHIGIQYHLDFDSRSGVYHLTESFA